MILEAADEAGLPPTRISFKNRRSADGPAILANSLHLIRMFCTVNAWMAPAGTMKTQLTMLREMLSVLLLPERRPERRYKRHVKIKMSGYKRNPGRTTSTDQDHKGNDLK